MKSLNKLDAYTKKHLRAWLAHTVPARDHAATRRRIGALLDLDAGLLEGHSWPELLAMAERGGIGV